MVVEELNEADDGAPTVLWEETELTRPWNDPGAEFRRALKGPTSAVLGLRDEGEIVGTVMVGFDGHRGWVYYLAVTPRRQNHGLGLELMKAAEDWLSENGATKVQLMVRHENERALGLYQQLNHEVAPVVVLSRWLESAN